MTKPEIIIALAALSIEASPRLLKAELEKLLADEQIRRESIKQARLAEGLCVPVKLDLAALERIKRAEELAALARRHQCRPETAAKIQNLLRAGHCEPAAVEIVRIMLDRGVVAEVALKIRAREAESRRMRAAQSARRRDFVDSIPSHGRAVNLADLQAALL